MKNYKKISFLFFSVLFISIPFYGIGCDTVKELATSNKDVIAKIQTDGKIALRISKTDLRSRILNDKLVKEHLKRIPVMAQEKEIGVEKVGNDYMAFIRGADADGKCLVLAKTLNQNEYKELILDGLITPKKSSAMKAVEGEVHSCAGSPCEYCVIVEITLQTEPPQKTKGCKCYGFGGVPNTQGRCNHTVTSGN